MDYVRLISLTGLLTISIVIAGCNFGGINSQENTTGDLVINNDVQTKESACEWIGDRMRETGSTGLEIVRLSGSISVGLYLSGFDGVNNTGYLRTGSKNIDKYFRSELLYNNEARVSGEKYYLVGMVSHDYQDIIQEIWKQSPNAKSVCKQDIADDGSVFFVPTEEYQKKLDTYMKAFDEAQKNGTDFVDDGSISPYTCELGIIFKRDGGYVYALPKGGDPSITFCTEIK